jgi:hypothetical protein
VPQGLTTVLPLFTVWTEGSEGFERSLRVEQVRAESEEARRCFDEGLSYSVAAGALARGWALRRAAQDATLMHCERFTSSRCMRRAPTRLLGM